MADQPALGPNGQLLDASKIVWYNDPDDDRPIQPTSDTHRGIAFNSFVTSERFICHHHTGHCTRSSVRVTTGSARLAAAIDAEKHDEFGNLLQPHRQRASAGQPRNSRATIKRKRTDMDDASTDADDDDFTAASTDDGSDNDGDTDIMQISNEEVSANETITRTTAHRGLYFVDSRYASLEDCT
jgi:hypothetical protein